MRQFDPEHVDLLAQTMFSGYYGDGPVPLGGAALWAELSTANKGRWRRAAQAAMRALAGNSHWIFPLPTPEVG